MSDSDDSAVSTFDLEDEPNQQAPHFQCATNAEQEQRDKAENNAIQQKGAAARRAAKEVALCEWRMQQEEQAHKSMPCTKAEQPKKEDLEPTKGPKVPLRLKAVPLSTSVVAAKGVKRSEDKVILPASFHTEQHTNQRASEHNQVFWRISTRDGRSTVASVLEFTAPVGVIQIQPKVVYSLWGLDATPQGEVMVSNHSLEPCTFAAFTPQAEDFQKALQAADVDLQALLQSTLKHHTALSVGDWISVTIPSCETTRGWCARWCAGWHDPRFMFHQLTRTITERWRPGCNADDAQVNVGETLLQADLEVLPAAQYWLQVSELQPHMCVSLEDTQPVVEVRTATAELMEGDAVEQVLERAHAERAAALKAEEEREQQAEAGEVTHLIRPSEDNKSRAPQGPPSRYVKELDSRLLGKCMLAEDSDSELVEVNLIPRGLQVNENVQREINMQSSLQHPNVIGFKRVFLTDEHLGIVQEHATGGELFERVKAVDRFDECMARFFFQQLIAGVDYIHHQAVMHEELKLEKTFIQLVKFKPEKHPFPVLKISEFGISEFCKPEERNSARKYHMGTPAHISPEQLHAPRTYDGKAADVWACAVHLYIMLVGCYPFRDPREPTNFSRTASNICKAKFRFPMNLQISQECKDLIAQMLQRDPRHRITIPEIQQTAWFQTNLGRGLKHFPGGLPCYPPCHQSKQEIERILSEARTEVLES